MRASAAFLLLVLLLVSGHQTAAADACPRSEFEAVVDQASSTLVELNQKNTPTFQTKLRTLKDKRGWTHEQFIKDAAPFVRDETIAGFDDKSQQLLVKINAQGNDGAGCKVLDDLKAAMAALVQTQNAKWTYMFDKIEKELAK